MTGPSSIAILEIDLRILFLAKLNGNGKDLDTNDHPHHFLDGVVFPIPIVAD